MINATDVMDMDIGTRQDNSVGPIIAEAPEDTPLTIAVPEADQDIDIEIITGKIPRIDTEKGGIQEAHQETGVGQLKDQEKDRAIGQMTDQEVGQEKTLRTKEEKLKEMGIGRGKETDQGIRKSQERDIRRDQETISQSQGRKIEEDLAKVHQEATAKKDTADLIT